MIFIFSIWKYRVQIEKILVPFMFNIWVTFSWTSLFYCIKNRFHRFSHKVRDFLFLSSPASHFVEKKLLQVWCIFVVSDNISIQRIFMLFSQNVKNDYETHNNIYWEQDQIFIIHCSIIKKMILVLLI